MLTVAIGFGDRRSQYYMGKCVKMKKRRGVIYTNLDCLVPAPSGKYTSSRSLDPPHRSNRGIMGTNLLALTGTQVEHFGSLIYTSREEPGAILVPTDIQDGTFMGIGGLSLALALVVDFVYSHL
jgi:hypothetical protein